MSQMMRRTLIDRISPLWLGIGISGSLVLILVLVETALGRWGIFLVEGEFDVFARVSSGELRDFRLALVHCLVIGYLPAAFVLVLQRSRQTVLSLQEVLNCTQEECEALAASLRLSRPGFIIFGLCGVLLAIAGPYLVPPVPDSPWNPSTWSPEVFWHRIGGPVATVWTWWLGYAVISVSLRMSRIATRLQRIDLLDLSPLLPFTQLGLTNALMLVGSLSIWSLMLVETGFGMTMIVAGTATLISTTIALWLPVRGVHKRICQSKQQELSELNRQISRRRSLLKSEDISVNGGEMADLITYRGLVDSVSEWPFTSSTYARVFLYALMPVAAWGVGIIAEEVVARVYF